MVQIGFDSVQMGGGAFRNVAEYILFSWVVVAMLCDSSVIQEYAYLGRAGYDRVYSIGIVERNHRIGLLLSEHSYE